MFPKLVVRVVLAAVILFALIQLIPYGRAHENPSARDEPTWDSPQTRALSVRACYDCHSNETRWPWYSGVAPISWVIQNHVVEGRETLNFSDWTRPQPEAAESAEEVSEGEMPPAGYGLMHPEARLSASERQQLIQGLRATLGGHSEGRERGD